MSDVLAAFLVARIAEDEQTCGTSGEPESWCDRAEGAHYDSRRVLAECEAKRRIVAAWKEAHPNDRYVEFSELSGQEAWDLALRILALPYREHPDYNLEWSDADR